MAKLTLTSQTPSIHPLRSRFVQPVQSQDKKPGPVRLNDAKVLQQPRNTLWKTLAAGQSRYIQNDCIHLRHTREDQPAHNHGSIVLGGQVQLGRDRTARLMPRERLQRG